MAESREGKPEAASLDMTPSPETKRRRRVACLIWAGIAAVALFPLWSPLAIIGFMQVSSMLPAGPTDPCVSISATGDRLLVLAAGRGGADLYVVTYPDLQVQRVTNTAEREGAGVLSPDGRAVVYSLDRPPAGAALVSRSLGTGAIEQLTTPPREAVDTPYCYCDGGRAIAFVRTHGTRPWHMGGRVGTDRDVYRVAADGRWEARLTEQHLDFLGPVSTDAEGNVLLWRGATAEGMLSTWLLDLAPGAATPQEMPEYGAAPALSPEGDRVAFVSDEEQAYRYEVWVARRNGTERRQLTHLGAQAQNLCWLPDGSGLLFLIRGADTGFELWYVSGDGATCEQVTRPGFFTSLRNTPGGFAK